MQQSGKYRILQCLALCATSKLGLMYPPFVSQALTAQNLHLPARHFSIFNNFSRLLEHPRLFLKQFMPEYHTQASTLVFLQLGQKIAHADLPP